MNAADYQVLSGAAFGAGGLGGLWAYLSTRAKAKPEMRTADAAITAAVATMAETFAEEMRKLVAEQKHEIEDLRDTVENLKTEAASCRREGEELRGENRQLRHIVGILVRKMREHGIDLPLEASIVGLVEVERDGLTVVAAVRGRRTQAGRAT